MFGVLSYWVALGLGRLGQVMHAMPALMHITASVCRPSTFQSPTVFSGGVQGQLMLSAADCKTKCLCIVIHACLQSICTWVRACVHGLHCIHTTHAVLAVLACSC